MTKIVCKNGHSQTYNTNDSKLRTQFSKSNCAENGRTVKVKVKLKCKHESSRNLSSACIYFVPVLAAILCYLNGLDGDFVHDDVYAIRDNPDANGKAPIGNLFWNDFWGKPMCDDTSHKSYRPITVLSFR